MLEQLSNKNFYALNAKTISQVLIKLLVNTVDIRFRDITM